MQLNKKRAEQIVAEMLKDNPNCKIICHGADNHWSPEYVGTLTLTDFGVRQKIWCRNGSYNAYHETFIPYSMVECFIAASKASE